MDPKDFWPHVNNPFFVDKGELWIYLLDEP